MRFAKGHGTENDFVILPDPDGELRLTPATVTVLCDRRAGIGADGVLRVVRTKSLGEPLPPGAESAEDSEWFMDYRNADGSIAEMCGNGVRVFARYLLEHGYVTGGETGAEFAVGTRAGLRHAVIEADGDVTVDMGRVRLLGPGSATLRGQRLDGQRVSVGNPHLACPLTVPVPVPVPVSEADLTEPPVFDPEQFPEGANLEVFVETAPGVLDMRVYERGSGETRSCGTGIVAAAAAAAAAENSGTSAWRVHVPGGAATVLLDGHGGARLRGPAVIVAEGDILLPDLG